MNQKEKKKNKWISFTPSSHSVLKRTPSFKILICQIKSDDDKNRANRRRRSRSRDINESKKTKMRRWCRPKSNLFWRHANFISSWKKKMREKRIFSPYVNLNPFSFGYKIRSFLCSFPSSLWLSQWKYKMREHLLRYFWVSKWPNHFSWKLIFIFVFSWFWFKFRHFGIVNDFSFSLFCH